MNHRRSLTLATLDGCLLLFLLMIGLTCAPLILASLFWLLCGAPHQP